MSNSPSKSPWLNRIKNGHGSDSPTWKGDTRKSPIGDFYTKRALVDHLRRTGLIK
jgi:hypothetical protein